jgi:hypothetical protein
MEEIWSDIRVMATPSWMASVPKDLGSGNHGKVKADQWRILGTTYLPVSLVRLWGKVHPGDQRSERCRKILDITISLLSAVTIATSRVTSCSRADSYLQHMQAYLNGIQELFPEYKLHPNHHMALHLHEYLILFGPVHAWWTFPFERIIGQLQRIPTNSKIGKIACILSIPRVNQFFPSQVSWRKRFQSHILGQQIYVVSCTSRNVHKLCDIVNPCSRSF